MKMLEDPDAFRPRPRQRTSGSSDGEEPLSAVAAGLAAESMVTSLMGWAALMPSFATHLVGAPSSSDQLAMHCHRRRVARVRVHHGRILGCPRTLEP